VEETMMLRALIIASLASGMIVPAVTQQADTAMSTGPSTGRSLGWRADLWNGTVSSYADFDDRGTPTAIGIVFSASALDGLPASGSDRHHCFDQNKEEAVKTECYPTDNTCFPIKPAPAVGVSGFYPTVSRIRRNAATAEITAELGR
jgi:hypothetical protein